MARNDLRDRVENHVVELGPESPKGSLSDGGPPERIRRRVVEDVDLDPEKEHKRQQAKRTRDQLALAGAWGAAFIGALIYSIVTKRYEPVWIVVGALLIKLRKSL